MTARPLGLFRSGDPVAPAAGAAGYAGGIGSHRAVGHVPGNTETMRTAGHDPRKGGRPSHDAVRLFKVLVLRELYTLSDEQVE